jgi:hypothetical protein
LVKGAAVREVATTLLDMVGLLLVAAGVGMGVAVWIHWWALVVAGAVVLTGSYFAELRGRAVNDNEPVR